MEVTAIAKNVRVTPQKVKLIVDQIKKMPPQKAITILPHIHKAAAKPLKKVIASAIANAKNNFGLDENTLSFRSVLVGKGIVFKRYRPVARGRAHPILKRTSYITVILEGEEKKKEVAKATDVSQKSEGGVQSTKD